MTVYQIVRDTQHPSSSNKLPRVREEVIIVDIGRLKPFGSVPSPESSASEMICSVRGVMRLVDSRCGVVWWKVDSPGINGSRAAEGDG